MKALILLVATGYYLVVTAYVIYLINRLIMNNIMKYWSHMKGNNHE